MVYLPGVQVRFGLSKCVNHFFKHFGDEYSTLYSYSRNDMGSGDAYSKSGFSFVRETGPSLLYVNPRDPYDTYSWAINSSWGLKGGVLSKYFSGSENTKNSRRDLIINHLPRRSSGGLGYVEVYNSGSRLWKITSDKVELDVA